MTHKRPELEAAGLTERAIFAHWGGPDPLEPAAVEVWLLKRVGA